MNRMAVPAFVCLLALATSACLGATIKVPDDQATIAAAVAAASEGDLINVSPGAYSENVVVNKAVVIRGVKGSDVTSVAAAAGADPVFLIKASDVTVSGFTISGTGGLWGAGVCIDGYDYASANGFTAGLSDVTVSKCVIELNTIGVLVMLADNTMIINNTIRSNGFLPPDKYCGYSSGIMVYDLPGLPRTLGTKIVNNEIYQNDGSGVWFDNWDSSSWDVTGTKIVGNNFYGNGSGEGGWLPWASDISMSPAQGSIKISGNKFLERIVQGYPVHGFYTLSAPGAKVVGNPEREELGPNIPMPTP